MFSESADNTSKAADLMTMPDQSPPAVPKEDQSPPGFPPCALPKEESFDSSSDSDSEIGIDKRIHIEIKPITNGKVKIPPRP